MPASRFLDRIREPLRIDAALSGKIWDYQRGPNFAPLNPHVHVELELNLCVRGEAEYLMEGGRTILRPGRILWLFPEQDHALWRASEDFCMWIAVFRPALLKHACRQSEHRALRSKQTPDDATTHAQLTPTETKELDQIYRDAYQQMVAGHSDRFNAQLHLLLLESWSRTQSARQQRPDEDTLHPAVFRAAMRIYEDPTCESLTTLAREAGLSLEHLSRLFAKQMSQTMSAYRSEQRLRRFAQLIDGERFNLTEAALEAGFGSYAQCYRVCRDVYSVKPSALRRPQ